MEFCSPRRQISENWTKWWARITLAVENVACFFILFVSLFSFANAMAVRFFWIKWLYNFALEPLAKFLAFFRGRGEWYSWDHERMQFAACTLLMWAVLARFVLPFLSQFFLMPLIWVQLSSSEYSSHLSTAVLSVHTRTHAPLYTPTPTPTPTHTDTPFM